MATGFHGFHVIIGTIFLTVCLGRAIAGQFTPDPPFRLRGGGLVLALRRRGVAVPVRLHLCLGPGPGDGWLIRARVAKLSSASVRAAGRGRCSTAISSSSRRCPSCGLDYAMFDAGDGPAVFGILIVGAIVCGAGAVCGIHLLAALLGACGAVDSPDRDPHLRLSAPVQIHAAGAAIQAQGGRRAAATDGLALSAPIPASPSRR